MSSLLVVQISKAAAIQRTGRAGRTCRGYCYRLYTKESYEKDLDEQTTPEIQRSDLCNVLLLMFAAGISDPIHFPFIDLPDYKLLKTSIEELYFPGAITLEEEVDEKGKLMSLIPVEPKLATAFITSGNFGCSYEMAKLIALLSEQGQPFMRPAKDQSSADAIHRRFKCGFIDHISLLRAFREFEKNTTKQFCQENFLNFRLLDRAYKSRQQLLSLLQKHNIHVVRIYDNEEELDPERVIIHGLLQGMFMQTCVHNPSTKKYAFLTGQKEAQIHPSSTIRSTPTWLIYQEYIRYISDIDLKWIIPTQREFFDPNKFPIGAIKNALNRLINDEQKQKNK